MALASGSRGEDVKRLQQALVDAGYDLGTFGPNGDGVDGIFGPVTEAALRAYQSDNGLTVDGVFGPETEGSLYGTEEGDTTQTETTDPATTQALPRNSKLVKIGNVYRVIWDLGDNLGWAWYDIDADQLENIYGTSTPTPHFSLSNMGQFEAQYGNNYWGNIAEVNLKADDPWEDLKDRIFSQFGFVPGFDESEIKRLMVEAYFEDWNQSQFFVEYRNTDFFQTATDAQRQWAGLSEQERQSRINEQAAKLKDMYQTIWSSAHAIDDEAINAAAFSIVSGQSTLAEWEWTQRTEAARDTTTLEFMSRQQEAEDLLAEGNEVENLTAFAENQWRAWVGPVDMPANFATRWGSDLASGQASEADLLSYLKDISNGRWTFKPPNLTWEDWASTYKSQIKRTLELGSLDDADPLLNQVLSTDLTGVDLTQLIRQDDRFTGTQTMFQELSSGAEDLGRRFGFIT